MVGAARQRPDQAETDSLSTAVRKRTMVTTIFARVPRSQRPANLGAVAWQTLVGLLVAALTSVLVLDVVPAATLKGVAAGVVVVGSIWFLTTRNSQLALVMILLYIGL